MEVDSDADATLKRTFNCCQMRLIVCVLLNDSFIPPSCVHHPLPSAEGLRAALGCSPQRWQLSGSSVRCWGGAECLRINRLFSLRDKDGVTMSSGHVVSLGERKIIFMLCFHVRDVGLSLNMTTVVDLAAPLITMVTSRAAYPIQHTVLDRLDASR